MSASTRSFSFSFHIKILAQGFSRRKKKKWCAFVFKFSHFELIGFLRASIYIYIRQLFCCCCCVLLLRFCCFSCCRRVMRASI
jgi:hypothetical protein